MDFGHLFSVTYWSVLWARHADRVVESAAKIAVIVAAYFIVRLAVLRLVSHLSSKVADRASGEMLQARKARILALQTILGSTVGFVLGFVAVIMILQAVGINIVPLITTASVAGLAVGFGAQKLVRDVIAGAFILAEDQYGVGEYVTIGAVAGVVEELGMRITRIRDSAGKLYIIANGDIAQVCNHSRGKLIATHDVAVQSSADLDSVVATLNSIGVRLANEMPAQVKEPFRCEGLSQVASASISVRMVGGVAPGALEEVQTRLNLMIREASAGGDLPIA